MLSYLYYDTISEHILLKACLVLSGILLLVVFFADLISFFVSNKESDFKKNTRSLISRMRYLGLFLLVVCLFFGIIIYISDNKVVMSSDIYSRLKDGSEHDSTETPIIFGEESILKRGNIKLSDESSYKLAYNYLLINTSISNNSQRTITIKFRDAVTLDLIEFIPYDQLDVKSLDFNDIGAGDYYYPISFVFSANTGNVKQELEKVYDDKNGLRNTPLNTNGSYEIDPNETREINIEMTLHDEGYYRFRYSISYYEKGEKKTKVFKECEFIYKELSWKDAHSENE